MKCTLKYKALKNLKHSVLKRNACKFLLYLQVNRFFLYEIYLQASYSKVYVSSECEKFAQQLKEDLYKYKQLNAAPYLRNLIGKDELH